MTYNGLLREAEQLGIHIFEKPMPYTTKGLYADNVIWINKSIPSTIEKACTLAEELGHHHTTTGNILDQSKITNRKQERLARAWGYKRLIPLQKIVQAHKEAIRNKHELADFLGVTEEFLEEAIKWYKEKYGKSKTIGIYTICFEPLGVLELLE